jgi:hypothetical protein
MNTQPLAGQRILLIGIGFYDYEAAIAAEFRALGAEVMVEDERPPEFRKTLRLLWCQWALGTDGPLRRHQTAMLARIQANGRFDHVLVIKGELLDEAFLRTLRTAQPTAHFIAYHWDSMARYPELLPRQTLFDRVLTFDHIDAATYGFILRPLFFRPECRPTYSVEETIDLCFVGLMHHDRLQQIEEIRRQAENFGLSTFFWIYVSKYDSIKLYLNKKKKDTRTRPLSFTKYVEKTLESKIIIDLPHPLQAGITMRAIEAMSLNKNIITTSCSIKFYNFYRKNKISILDKNNIIINRHEFNKFNNVVANDIIDQYSIRTWVLDVIGITKPSLFIQET